MREILFRGKTKSGKWEYGYYANLCEIWRYFMGDTKKYDIIETSSGTRCVVIPETICEYSGIKDKNGERIFEGDKVRASVYKHYQLNKPIYRNGTVEYIKGTFSIKWDDEYYGRDFLGYTYDVEVIGNVFDSPELISK